MNQALSDRSLLLPLARRLVASLEDDDDAAIDEVMTELTRIGDSSLYNQVGQLTRELHDALNSLRLGEEVSHITARQMPEARERLDYVNSLTEQAAMDTLSAMEQSSQVAAVLSQRAEGLARQWDGLRRAPREELVNALGGDLREFLGDAAMASEQLKVHFSEVQVAQSFQDLTGQIIRKVTDIVVEIEDKLVELVVSRGLPERQREAEPVEAAAGADITAQGPAIPGLAGSEVVSGQDEVDDLLAELGF